MGDCRSIIGSLCVEGFEQVDETKDEEGNGTTDSNFSAVSTICKNSWVVSSTYRL